MSKGADSALKRRQAALRRHDKWAYRKQQRERAEIRRKDLQRETPLERHYRLIDEQRERERLQALVRQWDMVRVDPQPPTRFSYHQHDKPRWLATVSIPFVAEGLGLTTWRDVEAGSVDECAQACIEAREDLRLQFCQAVHQAWVEDEERAGRGG